MKKYSKYLIRLGVVFLLLGAVSCSEDFLEVTPKSQLSTESVFQSMAGADLFLNDIYKQMPDPEAHGGWGAPGSRYLQNHSTYENLNMFAHYYVCTFSWSISQRRSQDRAYGPDTYGGRTGLYNHGWPANPFRYDRNTSAIRACNFFMEKLEENKDNYDAGWMTMRMAEARVLRASSYHEMWKAYGGVPLITEVLDQLTMGDDIFKPSTSINELYTFMVTELGEAADDLPDEIGDGHVTKGAALALKAYIELFMGDIAADPRPAAIGDLGDPNTYYTACANTCQQIMDLGTYSLFPSYNDQFLEANNFNSESIWAYPHAKSTNASNRTHRSGPFESWTASGPSGSYIPTQELVDMYRMDNGLPIDDPASGYDPLNPYDNREQRFYESIIHDSTKFHGVLFTLEGIGEDGNLHRAGAQNSTGYWRRKGIDETLTADAMKDQEACNSPVFRYAEVLLMFAEAKIKLGQADASAIAAIDEVRERGDLPTINDTYGGIPSQAELLDVIWHERAVELSWEGYKHYWDLIRTRNADIYLNQPCTGIDRDAGGFKSTTIYNNVWPSDHNYLFPMYRPWLERNPEWMDAANQVNGRTLGQNPGY